jgi:xanthine dehydrogenase molybdopterin-binding subunit B
MHHIAKVVKKDPVEVKLNNMSNDDNATPQMVKDLIVSADYSVRKESIDEFNKASCFFSLFSLSLFSPLFFKIKPFHTIYIILECSGVHGSFLQNISQLNLHV